MDRKYAKLFAGAASLALADVLKLTALVRVAVDVGQIGNVARRGSLGADRATLLFAPAVADAAGVRETIVTALYVRLAGERQQT